MAQATSERPAWRKTIDGRLLLLAACFAVWAVVIFGRLVYLQVIVREQLQAEADSQQNRTQTLPAKRGDIIDRNGRLLAYSVDVDVPYAVPNEISDRRKTAAALCAAIEGCTAADREELVARLAEPRPFAYLWPSVRRQVSPADAERIRALGLQGIGLLKESRRFYPYRDLLANVLGFVRLDNSGGAGLEAVYDGSVRGREGTVLIQVDARQKAFNSVAVPPTAGATLELTIDATLQYIVESELRRGVAENRAESAVAVVMDPRNGDVLAMANYPTFNPNRYWDHDARERRNRAVQDLYEPGSTFKIVSASAALEEGVVDPRDPIDVSQGYLRIGGRRIDDVHRYGVLSYTDVLVKSSNVGAALVGMRTGAERLTRYIRRFGFGSRLSTDFPGENPGIVWDPARLNDSAVASISMGYQIGVTPLQMVTAASAIANGGEVLQPRIVRALVEGGQRRELPVRKVRRAVEPATAAVLTGIMEQVVERGTATAARIPGYSIAGKTGTAQKLVNGQYSKTDYNASFVGFFPARAPALAMIVLVSSPRARGYYGGTVAAPIFKRIAERAIRHYGILPDFNTPTPVLASRQPEGGRNRKAAYPVLASTRGGERIAEPGAIPDLYGLSARAALRVVTRLGMTATLEGEGEVIGQHPAPGTRVQPGDRCVLSLGWSGDTGDGSHQ